MDAPKLRIGVMLNSLTVPAWTARTLEQINASGFAKLCLLVMNQAKPREESFWQKVRTNLLYRLYVRLDRRLFRGNYDAFRPVDLSAIAKEVDVIAVTPMQTKFVDRFEDKDVAEIKKADLDVILRFGFRIIKGDILRSAKYGVWSFHHDDNREYRGGPPLFWEIYERNPASGSILQVLTETVDGGKVIYRGLCATNERSLYLNQNPVYWKSAEYVMRRLRDVHHQGSAFLDRPETWEDLSIYSKPLYRWPSNRVMLRFAARLGVRFLSGRFWKYLGRVSWFIAVRKKASKRTLPSNMDNFRLVIAPSGSFYADPCLVKVNGCNFLFVEDYRYNTRKAVISCMEIDEQGNPGQPFVVLERNYHLSYPLVFEWDGQMYMIPETRSNRTVELYRATSFPYQWQLEKVIMNNVTAADATAFQKDGKLWLFAATAVEGTSPNDELSLFWADSPTGPWTPHPRNPVVADVRSARPAGALFFHNGQLIRPAQDCSKSYGHSLCFNRVEMLSETEYRETEVARITPAWLANSLGVHTFTQTEDFEVVDCRFILSRFGLRRTPKNSMSKSPIVLPRQAPEAAKPGNRLEAARPGDRARAPQRGNRDIPTSMTSD